MISDYLTTINNILLESNFVLKLKTYLKYLLEAIITIIAFINILLILIYLMDPILWDLLSDHFKQAKEIPLTHSEVEVPTIEEPLFTKTKLTVVIIIVCIISYKAYTIYNGG